MCVVVLGTIEENYIKCCFAASPSSSEKGKKKKKDIGIVVCSAEIRNNTAYHLLKYSNKTTWHTSIGFHLFQVLQQNQNPLRNGKNKKAADFLYEKSRFSI